jgi:hypothetical protein
MSGGLTEASEAVSTMGSGWGTPSCTLDGLQCPAQARQAQMHTRMGACQAWHEDGNATKANRMTPGRWEVARGSAISGQWLLGTEACKSVQTQNEVRAVWGGVPTTKCLTVAPGRPLPPAAACTQHSRTGAQPTETHGSHAQDAVTQPPRGAQPSHVLFVDIFLVILQVSKETWGAAVWQVGIRLTAQAGHHTH